MATQWHHYGNRSVQATGVSPFSSQHHSRWSGKGQRVFNKHSLKATAPLIAVGVIAAITLAVGGTTSHKSPASVKAAQTEVNVQHNTPTNNSQPANQTGAGSSTNVSVDGSGGSTSRSVNVNGQDIDVPDNGSVSNTINNPDGSTTTYSVDTSTQGDATNHSSSSTHINVHSSSSSSSSSSTSVKTSGGGSSN